MSLFLFSMNKTFFSMNSFILFISFCIFIILSHQLKISNQTTTRQNKKKTPTTRPKKKKMTTVKACECEKGGFWPSWKCKNCNDLYADCQQVFGEEGGTGFRAGFLFERDSAEKMVEAINACYEFLTADLVEGPSVEERPTAWIDISYNPRV